MKMFKSDTAVKSFCFSGNKHIHYHNYHLRPPLKCEEFCAKFYFSNVDGLSGYVSLLTNEILVVML